MPTEETTRYASRMRRVRSSPIMDILREVASGKYVNFASGLPDPALFPAAAIRRAYDDCLATGDAAGRTLQYGSEGGYEPLRERIAADLSKGGTRFSGENVLVTAGSQQALDLAARLLLDPGDTVAVEDPTYAAFLQIVDCCEARAVGVPMDEDGMDVERLEAWPEKPKLVFSLPDFQNPTGLSMSVERRRRLVQWGRRHGVPILEDGAYAALRYEGERRPSLLDLSDGAGVLSTGTFSKTIAPGLRVGWIAGEKEAIARIALLKQAADIQTSTLAQMATLRYLEAGGHDAHVEFLRRTIDERRRRLLGALEGRLPDGSSLTRPRGGMFAWVTLPPGADSERLLRAAFARGVAFVPGRAFHPGESPSRRTIRLNFASSAPETISRGVPLLLEAMTDVAK
jgi:2-aminoadipate transaminase